MVSLYGPSLFKHSLAVDREWLPWLLPSRQGHARPCLVALRHPRPTSSLPMSLNVAKCNLGEVKLEAIAGLGIPVLSCCVCAAFLWPAACVCGGNPEPCWGLLESMLLSLCVLSSSSSLCVRIFCCSLPPLPGKYTSGKYIYIYTPLTWSV